MSTKLISTEDTKFFFITIFIIPILLSVISLCKTYLSRQCIKLFSEKQT